MYNHAPELVSAAHALLVDAIDRCDCWKEGLTHAEQKTETMYDDYRALALALDKIALDIKPAEFPDNLSHKELNDLIEEYEERITKNEGVWVGDINRLAYLLNIRRRREGEL